jgi:hypothetical protein
MSDSTQGQGGGMNSGLDATPHVTNREALGGFSASDIEVNSRDLAALIEIDVSRTDPRFRYRLVHNSRLKAARARAKGYVIVDPDQEEIYTISGDKLEVSADNIYRVGDTFLMKIALREYKARRVAKRKKTEERLSGPKKKFKSLARSKRDRAGQTVEVITSREPGEHAGPRRKGR